jgi:hypothetical protein
VGAEAARELTDLLDGRLAALADDLGGPEVRASAMRSA